MTVTGWYMRDGRDVGERGEGLVEQTPVDTPGITKVLLCSREKKSLLNPGARALLAQIFSSQLRPSLQRPSLARSVGMRG